MLICLATCSTTAACLCRARSGQQAIDVASEWLCTLRQRQSPAFGLRACSTDAPSPFRQGRLQCSVGVALSGAGLVYNPEGACYRHTATKQALLRPNFAALPALPLTALQHAGSQASTSSSASVSPRRSACCCATMAAPTIAGPHLTDAACAASHMVQIHCLDGVHNDGLRTQPHLQCALHLFDWH